jgi:hypothetical protein
VNVFRGRVNVPAPVAVTVALPVNVPLIAPPIFIEPDGVDVVDELNDSSLQLHNAGGNIVRI